MTTMSTLYNMNFVRFDSAEDIGMDAKANGTNWMKTMTAHECVLELCAWSFTNWSHLDGALQEGPVAQSKLKIRDATVEIRFWDQDAPFVFETADSDFPGNQTYTIATADRRAMLQTFYTMWDRPRATRRPITSRTASTWPTTISRARSTPWLGG